MVSCAKVPRFYTKTGDQGSSAIFGGKRLKKSAPIFTALGALDELNAVLGIVRAANRDRGLAGDILKLQDMLFLVTADMATPKSTKAPVRRIDENDVARLERCCAKLEKSLPRVTKFIIPGETPLGAWLHFARTLARRAERAIVQTHKQRQLANQTLLVWINRLSSLLFVLALLQDIKKKRHLSHPTYRS